MRNFIRVPLTISAISLLAACGSAIKLSDTPVESRVPVLVGEGQVSAAGAASRSGAAGTGAGTTGRQGGAPGSGAAASAGGGRGTSGAGGLGGIAGGSTGSGGGSAGSVGGSGVGIGSGSGASMGSAGLTGAGSTSGFGGANPAGTALPSAVGESRLASISAVTPPPMAPRDDPAVLPPGMARIVYFDFDSFVVRNDARPVIEAHARVLTADRARRMEIELHTDDRGGRE